MNEEVLMLKEEKMRHITVCENSEQCKTILEYWNKLALKMVKENVNTDPKKDGYRIKDKPDNIIEHGGFVYVLHESLNKYPNDLVFGGWIESEDYITRCMVYQRYQKKRTFEEIARVMDDSYGVCLSWQAIRMRIKKFMERLDRFK